MTGLEIIQLISLLSPLAERAFITGTAVSQEELEAAFAGFSGKVDVLEALIAAKKAQAGG